MPEIMATGTASSKGQGVATTSTARARSTSPLASQAAPASNRASGMNQKA
jgi:hypothetical protein